MNQQRLDPWVEGYMDYMRDVRRIAHKTLIDIRCTLKRVIRAIHKIRPDVPVWKVSLEDFLAWINEEREQGRSEHSLAKDLSHVRGLLDYAWRSGRSDRNVLDGFNLQDNGQRETQRFLSMEEAEKLVRACGRASVRERRNRVVILLLYGCGLRTFELCNLDVQSVDLERQELFIAHGKGDRQRRIPIPGGLWTELLAYMQERGGKRGPLFRTDAKRRKISSRDVCEIVKTTAARAGIAGLVTPKVLRHTFATHLMAAGVDLAIIVSLMGHRSPREVNPYLHSNSENRDSAVDKLLSRRGG